MRGTGGDQAVGRSGRSTLRARAGRERKILRIGLIASAVLHVVILGIVGSLLHSPPSPRSSSPEALVLEPPSGMRAVDLSPVVGTEPSTDVEPRRPAREEVVVVAPDAEEPSAREAVADDLTAADRLAPRLVDPRIWRPIVLMPLQPTLADVQARLGAAMELLSDSALADAERQLRAVDWTVVDADGEKWGVSPGVIHLGKVKIPLPIYYAEEYSPERDEWYDLEAQVDRTRFLESFEDRVKKIRERRERERRQGQEEEGGAVAGSGSGGR